jgi:hypothetical protein
VYPDVVMGIYIPSELGIEEPMLEEQPLPRQGSPIDATFDEVKR